MHARHTTPLSLSASSRREYLSAHGGGGDGEVPLSRGGGEGSEP